MKNQLLKGAVKVASLGLRRNQKTNRILVVATTALGDTLWATPALKNLRQSFPNSYLAVLTSPIGMEILEHNPSIDRLYLLTEPMLFSFFSLWKKLYQERFDTVLIFHASQRLIFPLCALLGAEQIVGTGGINKGLDCFLTHPLPNRAEHEIVRRLQIAEKIGASTSSQTLSFFLQPEEKKAAQLPPSSKIRIAIHPGSKDAFKRWPQENFTRLGQRLKESLPCDIFITGNAAEKDLMQKTARQIPGAQIYETKGSLRSFAALLEQMDLLISNDTGPVHLACALNRPVIALYSSTNPHLCGPHKAKNAIALYKPPTCSPCLKRLCKEPFCFLQLGPEEVLNASRKLLTDSKIPLKQFS